MAMPNWNAASVSGILVLGALVGNICWVVLQAPCAARAIGSRADAASVSGVARGGAQLPWGSAYRRDLHGLPRAVLRLVLQQLHGVVRGLGACGARARGICIDATATVSYTHLTLPTKA